MTRTEKGRRLIHARSPGKEARTKEKVEVGAAVDRAAEAVEKDHDLTGAEEYPPHPEGRKTRLEQSERLLKYLPTFRGGGPNDVVLQARQKRRPHQASCMEFC